MIPDIGSPQMEDWRECQGLKNGELPLQARLHSFSPQHGEKRGPGMLNSTRGHLASPSGGVRDSPAMCAALVVPEHEPEAQRLGVCGRQRPALHERRTARQHRHPRAVGRTLPQRREAGGCATPHFILRERAGARAPAPESPNLDSRLSVYPSSRAYSSSITLSSSFLKSGAGWRSAWPGGSSLGVQVPMAPL